MVIKNYINFLLLLYYILLYKSLNKDNQFSNYYIKIIKIPLAMICCGWTNAAIYHC